VTLTAGRHPHGRFSDDRYPTGNGAECDLRSVVEIALPVLRFVRRLDRVVHLIGDEQAGLDADVIRRQDFLAGDEQ